MFIIGRMIRIHCPGCERTLEVDEGFAGGVCRCSECGTMMTVPESRSARAQRVERPPRPDSPVAEAPTVDEPPDADAHAEPDAPTDPAMDAPSATDALAEQTPRSHSGRQGTRRDRAGRGKSGRKGKRARSDRHDHAAEAAPPTAADADAEPAGATAEPGGGRAPSALAVRLTVIGAVVLVLGGLSVVTILALSNLTVSRSGETTWTRRPVPEARVTENPFAMAEANLFGVPMPRAAVSVVIDSDQPVRDVLPGVGRLMSHGADTLPDGALLQAVIVHGTGTTALPESGLAEANEWDGAALSGALADLAEREPTGGSDMLAGIDRAQVANPDRVLMVIGIGPVTDVLNQWAELLNTTRPALDIVQVGPQSDQRLADLANEFDGRYVHITPGDLKQWDDGG